MTTNYAPCRSHINYLTQINSRISKVINNNNNKITNMNKQPTALRQKLTDLNIQKNQILNSKGVNI